MTGEFAVGVHAAVFLSRKKGVHSSEEIAERVGTNPARVRKILAGLKRAGLVETKEGSDGGYMFCLDAETVDLKMVADALGVTFVSVTRRKENSRMAGVMEELCCSMDQRCREYLEGVTIAQVGNLVCSGEEADSCRH